MQIWRRSLVMRAWVFPLVVSWSLLVAVRGQEPRPVTGPEVELTEGERQRLEQEHMEELRDYHGAVRVRARMIDDDGKPVESADVEAELRNLFHERRHVTYRGSSDEKGLFVVEGEGTERIRFVGSKEGHYSGVAVLEFREKEGERWLPWDEVVDVRLYRVENPIPLWVYGASVSEGSRWRSIPKTGEDVGFDLVRVDWVEPHGEGEIADLIFHARIADVGPDDGDVWTAATVRMANEDDGWVVYEENPDPHSEMKLPRSAPAGTYEIKQIETETRFGRFRRMVPLDGVKRPPWGYFFRIRTQRDRDTGEIKSALYGIIRKGLDGGSEVPPIQVRQVWAEGRLTEKMETQFRLYLNPTPGDRNLEWNDENLREEGLERVRIQRRDRIIEEMRKRREEERQRQEGGGE
jgi:hypothetical protein